MVIIVVIVIGLKVESRFFAVQRSYSNPDKKYRTIKTAPKRTQVLKSTKTNELTR